MLRRMWVGVLGPTVVTDSSADGRSIPLAAALSRPSVTSRDRGFRSGWSPLVLMTGA